ncbi:hypothetical protein B296_00040306, partial [Ensete ventricosum]
GFPNPSGQEFRRGGIIAGIASQPNLLEEQRAEAHLRTLAYKKVVVKLYN